LFLLNGARGGQVANRWDSADEENYTRIRDELLAPLGLSEQQVQVVWLKVANDARDKPVLPSGEADAYDLMETMGDIVRALKTHYPNLQQVFISSRIYAGYANRDINPEPYAYESGFAVKWLIEAQIEQMANGGRKIDPRAGDLNYDTVAPWLAWGPYLWADGSNPRSDGLTWAPEDFGNDGTHPSVIGREKVADQLLGYFKSSPYSRCWFIAAPGADTCERPVAEGISPTVEATSDRQPEFNSDNFTAIPLTDMGDATYLGFEGGLYPGGSNEMPSAHAETGLERALEIQPLNREGEPDPNGKIVFLSVGMSNTMMEFCGPYTDNINCKSYSFMGKAAADPLVNHDDLTILNGARGAQIAQRWDSEQDENYDRVNERLLVPLGLDERQVQVVWLKVVDFLRGNPSLPSGQADAYHLAALLGDIVRSLKVRYPNLQQVFLSSRTYAGYAKRDLSPEPYAYESGYAVKWLIEAQIEQMENNGNPADSLVGDLNYNTVAPWVAWGPYLWADGDQPRSDGLVWLPEDFQASDGTHPSEIGREKVASMLLEFFKTSPFTKCWFLDNGQCG
jgi:lysophospholipase L1-like esterase